jgi:hypothetical protein
LNSQNIVELRTSNRRGSSRGHADGFNTGRDNTGADGSATSGNNRKDVVTCTAAKLIARGQRSFRTVVGIISRAAHEGGIHTSSEQTTGEFPNPLILLGKSLDCRI